MAGSTALLLYKGIGYLAVPVLHGIYARRVARGKEIRQRKGERFGIPGIKAAAGSRIWVHAASVGETNSILPLVGSFCKKGYQVLLTTGTVTSAKVAAEALPDGAIHQFVPYDAKPLVERFLTAWQPSLAIMVESEIWPATLDALRLRNIPTVIVNGRMSQSSFEGWQRMPRLAKRLFGDISLCLAQSDHDAERFVGLGVRRVEMPGNLKFDTAPLEVDAAALADLSKRAGHRPRWLAASTHPGEEEAVMEAHRKLKGQFPDLLTVIVPRHPVRGQEVLDLCRSKGANAALRSLGMPLEETHDVYIADTLGEIGLFCTLCDIVFLGGSFVELGGHNPVEPAQLGCAVLTGPNIANNKRLFEALFNSGAAVIVDDAEELATEVADLFGRPSRVGNLADRALQTVKSGRGALERTEVLVNNVLKEIDCQPGDGGTE